MLNRSFNSKQTTRGPQPKLILWQGVARPVRQWAKLLNLDHRVLYARFRQGWPTEKALTKPTPKTFQEAVKELQAQRKTKRDKREVARTKARARYLRSLGKTFREIGATLGVHYSTVAKWVKLESD